MIRWCFSVASSPSLAAARLCRSGAPRPMPAAPLAPQSRRSGQRLLASSLAPCSRGLVSPPLPPLVSTPPVSHVLMAPLAGASDWSWHLLVGLLVLLKPLKLVKSVQICLLGLAAGSLAAVLGLAWRSWASVAPLLSVCAVCWRPAATCRRRLAPRHRVPPRRRLACCRPRCR